MYRFRFFVTAVSILFAVAANAAEPDVKAIKSSLTVMFPQMSFEGLQLRASPLPGILEAEVDTTVFYITNDGKHVLAGELFDIQTKKNLTEDRRTVLNAKVVKDIPEKNMVVFEPKDKKAKATMTVFTDVDCTYCRKLHVEEVPELNKQGVRVRYVLYPRSAPGTATYDNSVSVWCASDRLKAVSDAKAGKEVVKKSCNNPVADNQAVARRLGVSGTPVIFLDNGTKVGGYAPAAELLSMMGVK
jgi:thiol:disulfide interchange protein DsbC